MDLFAILKKNDPRRAKEIDAKNKVRLIRALEIVATLGKVPKISKKTQYDIEWVYLDFPDDILKERIHTRLLKRMKQGMVHEAERLHAQGLSFTRMEQLGLEYKYLALLLQKKVSKKEFLEQLESAIWHYVNDKEHGSRNTSIKNKSAPTKGALRIQSNVGFLTSPTPQTLLLAQRLE